MIRVRNTIKHTQEEGYLWEIHKNTIRLYTGGDPDSNDNYAWFPRDDGPYEIELCK